MKRIKIKNLDMNYCKYAIGLLCSILLLAMNCPAEKLNLFLSNETCILEFTAKNSSNFTIIFCQENGSLVGLDVDAEAGLIFWSNNDRTFNQSGIFSATLNGTNVTSIFRDTQMVNGLVVDRTARFLYWTDEALKYIQSCKYDGSNMRIIIYRDLQIPRGLVVDHHQGWLFWNDQGKQTVEMSMLDGSERRILASNVSQPNQMDIVNISATTRKLYFVDAANKSLKSILIDSSNTSSIIQSDTWKLELAFTDEVLNNETIFGLAVQGDMVYVSTWGECKLLNFHLTNKTSQVISNNLGKSRLFSLAISKGDVSSRNSIQNSTGTTDNSTHFAPNNTAASSTNLNSTANNSTDGNNSTNHNSTDDNNSTNHNFASDNNSTNHNITTDNNSTNHNITTDNNSTIHNVTTDNNSTIHNVTTDNNSTDHNITTDNNSTIHNVTTDNNSTNHNFTNDNSTTGNASHTNTSDPSPCNWIKSSCSHICIPLGPKLGYKCACPTYGGLILDDKGYNCTAPSNVLVYADMLYRHIGWLDASNDPSNHSSVLHLVARSSYPVAVAYDPLEKLVYWSDPKDRCIHKRPFNASQSSSIFLGTSDNIGVVDGMAIDYIRRNLYFSNMDESTIDGTLYSKHTVEVVSLNANSSRVIITRNVNKPRGLWIDFDAKHIYYTDWGQPAKVMRSNLDGTNAITILSNQTDQFQNPNSVVVSSNKVFVALMPSENVNTNESLANSSLPQGHLWYIDKDRLNSSLAPYNWSKSVLQGSQLPFGMATSSSFSSPIFISSWNGGCLLEYNLTTGLAFCFANLSGIGGLAFSDVNVSVVKDSTCNLSSDSNTNTSRGMCLGSRDGSNKFYCPSYGGLIMSSDNEICEVPKNFILIADMMAIKLLGYDTKDQRLYDVISGNFSTSYSALAYEPTSGTIYYSDVNQRTIRKTRLEKIPSTELFYKGPLVDDMLIHQGSLYWIDSAQDNVSIARVTLNNGSIIGGSVNQEVLLPNLATKKPKSLAIHKLKGHLYFTSDELPYVWRFSLKNESKDVVSFNASSLFQSGPLFIDEEEEVLYLLDKQSGSVTSCSLSSLNQTGAFKSVANLTGGSYFYSFAVYNNSIYYSDWADKSIHVFDLLNRTRRTVVGNLTRPTRFLIQRPTKTVPTVEKLPPYFIGCPRNIHVFTTNTQEIVWWKAPTLAGISDKKLEESVSVNIKPGSSLTLGLHVVKYSVSGAQGLTECSFNVSIVSFRGSLPCNKTYSVINGDLSCSTNSTPPSCKVECFKDYIPLFQGTSGVNFEFCGTGSNQTNAFFCAELLQKVATAQIKLEFSGSCPNDQNLFAFNLFYAFYSMKLCSPPDASYQSGADLCNLRNFRGIKCSGLGRRKRETQPVDSRFTVEMALWQIQSKIDKLNSSMSKLNVPYNDAYLKGINMTTNVTTSGCPTNSYEVDQNTCAICPYGTKFSATSKSCVICPENTYQPNDGQSTCDQCPASLASPPGSYDVRQCSPVSTAIPNAQPTRDENRVPLIVGIVVSLILGIIVVILLVLLACWHAKKKEDKLFESETRRRLDANRGYYGDYPEPEDDPIPLSTYGTSERSTRKGQRNSGFEMTASA